MKSLELKIPPVGVVLAFGVMMWLCARLLPGAKFMLPAGGVVAISFVLAGVLVAGLGFVSFRRARTTVNPMTPENSSTLVASGIYRHTRNPMYLGFLLWLAGWAAYLGNAVTLIFLPLFIVYMNAFQIGPEERALSKIFGESFKAYKGKVRRWL